MGLLLGHESIGPEGQDLDMVLVFPDFNFLNCSMKRSYDFLCRWVVRYKHLIGTIHGRVPTIGNSIGNV